MFVLVDEVSSILLAQASWTSEVDVVLLHRSPRSACPRGNAPCTPCSPSADRRSRPHDRKHPDLRVHQDGGSPDRRCRGFLHKFLPPCLLDVVLQLHTQRAVVPGVGQTAVNPDRRILWLLPEQRFFHCFFHDSSPLCFIRCVFSTLYRI